jgi:hypothetical protein
MDMQLHDGEISRGNLSGSMGNNSPSPLRGFFFTEN